MAKKRKVMSVKRKAAPEKLSAQGVSRVLPVEQIVNSPYNPQGRTDRVEEIGESLLKNGQYEEVHVVDFGDNTYVLADGHRRTAGAKAVGLQTLRARVYEPVDGQSAADLLSKLYVDLNQPKKTLKAGQMLSTALQGGPTFNSNVDCALRRLQDSFNDKELEMLNGKGVTPTTVNLARKSVRYVLGADVDEASATYRDRFRKHIFYLVRNNVQQAMAFYLRLGYNETLLREAIDNNRPLPRVSSPKMIAEWVK